MFGIFATITIKPEHRETLLSAIQETAHRSVREEPNCLRFDVFRDLAKEDRYLLDEVYVDEDALLAHLATPHASRAMEGSKVWGDSALAIVRTERVFRNGTAAFETVGSD